MKRILTLVLMAALLAGCADKKEINGKVYEPYGFFNKASKQDPNILYEVSAGSVIVAIIFSETLIVPVYTLGWDLWEPVKAKGPVVLPVAQ